MFDTTIIFRVHVAASPHGGPVALLSRPPSPAKPHIEIFNGAGRQIGAFKWNSGKTSNIHSITLVEKMLSSVEQEQSYIA